MGSLEPRHVGGECRLWFGQAIMLVNRNIMTNVILAIFVSCLFYFTFQLCLHYGVGEPTFLLLLLIIFLLFPVSIVAFISIAYAADYSYSFFQTLQLISMYTRLIIVKYVLMCSSLVLVTWVALFLILWSLKDAPVVTDSVHQALLELKYNQDQAYITTSFVVALCAYFNFISANVLLLFWYVTSLLMFTGCPLNMAANLNKLAYKKNRQAIHFFDFYILFIFMVLLFTLFIQAKCAFILILLLPYTGALMYVSYRDVFLHKRENSPVKIKKMVARSAETTI